MGERGLRLCLSGAALDSGNRGVEALGRSVLAGIARNAPASEVVVFDNGWGVRPGPAVNGLAVTCSGVRRSRRVHRQESWLNVRMSQSVGALGNRIAKSLRNCDAVLDISGGDSFADTYGPGRLQTVLEPKWAALRAGRPLVLLPQTYGPFTDATSRRQAARVVRAAELAISRDEESFVVLADLLGEAIDPARHRRGVDVAFALDPRKPLASRHRQLVDIVEAPRERPLVGLNVSGLLWFGATPGPAFDLALDYRQVCLDLVTALVADGADVLLVPHVRDVAHGAEDDPAATRALQGVLEPATARYVTIAPGDLDADEAKWAISSLDWFCGARMHSTIAGLSAGVPTSGVAYSMKTRAVFATCGVPDEVVDARLVSTGEAVARLRDAYGRRGRVRQTLSATVPPVVHRAETQLEHVLTHIHSLPSPRARCAS